MLKNTKSETSYVNNTNSFVNSIKSYINNTNSFVNSTKTYINNSSLCANNTTSNTHDITSYSNEITSNANDVQKSRYSFTQKMIWSTFCGLVFCGFSYASSITPCEEKLMSKPLCINKINAEQYCKSYGSSEAILNSMIECYEARTQAGIDRNSSAAMCFMGYVESSKADDNQTLCE